MATSRVEPDTFGAAAALERMVFFSDAVLVQFVGRRVAERRASVDRSR
jgi:hypothetical protein